MDKDIQIRPTRSARPTFRVEYFGCPTSQYEGEALRTFMQQEGFIEAQTEPAQIYIINSCVVTTSAARKVRQAARKAKKENPFAMVVISGCYPQVYIREIFTHLPEVEIAVGNDNRKDLPHLIRQRLEKRDEPSWNLVQASVPTEPVEAPALPVDYEKVRPLIKIQEGCDEECSYCIVTKARGRPRSLDPQKVIEQARYILENGFREVILTGTHIGIYGKEWQNWNLAQLIEKLGKLPYDYRLRLTSVEPMSIDEELLQVMASNKKICPYLYTPLQSGSDRVLELMGRGYNTLKVTGLLHRARELMPDISIYTDLITGFPGETEEDHYQTMELAKKLFLSGLHIFTFSPRPHTPAYGMTPKVRPDIKKRRHQELRDLGRELALQFHQKMEGKDLRVLVERVSNSTAEGFSDNYIWTRFKLPEKYNSSHENIVGQLFHVTPRRFYYWGIEGSIF